MNQKIIDYLKSNKDKYSISVLKDELVKSGYNRNDIEAAADFVYGGAGRELNRTEDKTVPWYNIIAKKEYNTKPEKTIDFLIGVFLPWIIGFVMHTINDDMLEDFLWLPLSIFIALMIITYKPRRYIFKGLYFNFSAIGMLVVAVILYFVIFNPRIF